MGKARGFGKLLRQKRRLVVAPPEKPGPVQRHGRHDHAGLKDRPDRAQHPARGRRGKVQPVAMFQRQHQPSAGIAVKQRRAPRHPGPGQRGAIVAKDMFVGRGVPHHGRAAQVADGSRDKRRVAPAGRAQAEIVGHRPAAGQALRREKNVQRALHSRPKQLRVRDHDFRST